MLLATRSWLPVSFDPPIWVTVSPLPDAEWEAAYAAVLLATSASPPVGYGLVSGSLPPGLSLLGDSIAGTPHPAPAAPVWVTPAGSLGATGQGAAFGASLSATGAAGYAVRAGRLPWGVTLDLATGALSGILAVIGGAEDDPGPPPVWGTPAGDLGTVAEGQGFGATLAATGAADFTIVGGRFPWGLALDLGTGAIAGTAADVGGTGFEPLEPIVWTAPAAPDLGSPAVGDAVSVGQATAPAAGAFAVTAGGLPWGLILDADTGAIAGTVSAEAAAGLHSFTVTRRDAEGRHGARDYTITIS